MNASSHPFCAPAQVLVGRQRKEELPLNKMEVKKILVQVHVQSTCCSFSHVSIFSSTSLSSSPCLCVSLSSVFPVLTDLQPPASLSLSLFIAPVVTIETCPTCSREAVQPHYHCGILGNAVIYSSTALKYSSIHILIFFNIKLFNCFLHVENI